MTPCYELTLEMDELEDGGHNWLVTVPSFPEITTFGDDIEEALRAGLGAIEEAIAGRERLRAENERLKAALSRIAYDEWEDGLALGENYNMSFLKGLAIKALKGGAPETSNRCLDRAEKQEIARLKGGDDD